MLSYENINIECQKCQTLLKYYNAVHYSKNKKYFRMTWILSRPCLNYTSLTCYIYIQNVLDVFFLGEREVSFHLLHTLYISYFHGEETLVLPHIDFTVFWLGLFKLTSKEKRIQLKCCSFNWETNSKPVPFSLPREVNTTRGPPTKPPTRGLKPEL